jgi:glutaminyl-peptide cyclotransferase
MITAVLAMAVALQGSGAIRFDADRSWAHLRQLVAMGPRPSGSPAIVSSRTYIEGQLRGFGLAVTEQVWTAATPVGPIRMVNVSAIIPGTRKERLIIGGHYDTKRFRDIAFVGANDGGSSAAFLLEFARVLAQTKPAFTIELLFLDGEEATIEWQGIDHTYGSRYYVEEARRGGSLSTIKAFVLVDMIADRDLRIKRDANSTPWLTDAVWEAATQANLGAYFTPALTQIEDDHLPFLAAGIPSVDIIDLDYPAWHTAGDTLGAVSAQSLQIVGDALLAALPAIQARLGR